MFGVYRPRAKWQRVGWEACEEEGRTKLSGSDEHGKMGDGRGVEGRPTQAVELSRRRAVDKGRFPARSKPFRAWHLKPGVLGLGHRVARLPARPRGAGDCGKSSPRSSLSPCSPSQRSHLKSSSQRYDLVQRCRIGHAHARAHPQTNSRSVGSRRPARSRALWGWRLVGAVGQVGSSRPRSSHPQPGPAWLPGNAQAGTPSVLLLLADGCLDYA